jgi:hypothetical protein
MRWKTGIGERDVCGVDAIYSGTGAIRVDRPTLTNQGCIACGRLGLTEQDDVQPMLPPLPQQCFEDIGGEWTPAVHASRQDEGRGAAPGADGPREDLRQEHPEAQIGCAAGVEQGCAPDWESDAMLSTEDSLYVAGEYSGLWTLR